MSRLGRRWITAGIAVLLVLAGTVALVIWVVTRHDEAASRDYRKAVAEDWASMSEGIGEVLASLMTVDSPESLKGLADSSANAAAEMERISKKARSRPAPEEYAALKEKEERALESLQTYLSQLEETATTGDREKIEQATDELQRKALRARSDLTDFLSAASFLDAENSFPADLFAGVDFLARAFGGDGNESTAEQQQVYDTMKSFMEADLGQFNIDTIWSAISSRLHSGLDLFQITKEKLASGWRDSWGDDPVKGYYVSPSSVMFPEPGKAAIKVIIYMRHGSPRIEEIRLVKEGDAWKVDSYPFVGWI